jgi:hypothetical protein
VRRSASQAERTASWLVDFEQETDEARKAKLVKLGVEYGYCDSAGNPVDPSNVGMSGRERLNEALRDARFTRPPRTDAGCDGKQRSEHFTLNDAIRRAHEESGPRDLDNWDTRRPL